MASDGIDTLNSMGGDDTPCTAVLVTIRSMGVMAMIRLYGGIGNDTLNGGDGNDIPDWRSRR